ncbi:MAG: hypothetical protein J6X18_01140 [Bacteroidales bacterium]|nr:hypothetical protein [Bacteroidales bacterium]
MKIWIGVNSDGSEIMSKRPIKRYIDYETSKNDVLSWGDTKRPPHWMLDYSGIELVKTGDAPIDVYLTLPTGSLKRMFGIDMTWEDEFKTIEL